MNRPGALEAKKEADKEEKKRAKEAEKEAKKAEKEKAKVEAKAQKEQEKEEAKAAKQAAKKAGKTAKRKKVESDVSRHECVLYGSSDADFRLGIRLRPASSLRAEQEASSCEAGARR